MFPRAVSTLHHWRLVALLLAVWWLSIPTRPAEPSLAGASVLPTTPPQTTPGVVLGTTGYMSPEQVRGREADARSDIFAFGAILYEMLAGRRAFRGDTVMDTMSAILKEDPPELPTADRRIPPSIARIVDRCLEKNPAARFQSARDLAFALEAISSHSKTGRAEAIAPAAPRRSARRWMPWLAAGLFLVALAAAAPWLLARVREASAVPDVIRFAVTPPPQAFGSPSGRPSNSAT